MASKVLPDDARHAKLKPNNCLRKMLSQNPEIQRPEHAPPKGEWIASLEQNQGFPVLVLKNRLDNGSGHNPPNFVAILFHPLLEDVIFRFPGVSQRPVATLGELSFLMEREGLPKNFSVDLKAVFDDWRYVNQQLTMETDDFRRLCQYFQGALEASLVIPVNFYERQTRIFLYQDYLVNSKEIGLQGRFSGQQKQIIDKLKHLLALAGDVNHLQYQGMAIHDFTISNRQWMGIRPKDQMQVAVVEDAGATINVSTCGILSSLCWAIFEGWGKLVDYHLTDERNWDLAHWLVSQRLS
ncbi:hypothetical protein HY388_01320 [Candidatus Daviesbacteria bacterium]|nr:hypothetical protein [Candidatus Daviesbacteria bacterium]